MGLVFFGIRFFGNIGFLIFCFGFVVFYFECFVEVEEVGVVGRVEWC